VFIGWDIELIQELPTLSADYLDEHFLNEIPLMIIAQSGHSVWESSSCGWQDTKFGLMDHLMLVPLL